MRFIDKLLLNLCRVVYSRLTKFKNGFFYSFLMEIYLAHLGENDGQSLTETGVWQMSALARRLQTEGVNVGKVYANGHNVSRQAAEILRRAVGSPIVHDERFVEINKSFIEGDFSELEFDNLAYIHLFVDEILGRGENALISLGDGMHRAIISRLTGLPLVSTRHFSLSPASLSVLKYHNVGSAGFWRLNVVNDVNHLSVP